MSEPQPTQLPVTERDLGDAAQAGIITTAQAQALWSHLAQAQSLPAVGAGPAARVHAAQAAHLTVSPGPRFSFTHVLYYFGGLLAISAMSTFMTLAFSTLGDAGLLLIALAYMAGCLKVADHFKARGLQVPAGILATLAIIMVPLAVWALQRLLGFWPEGGSDRYADYTTRISWRWMTLEFATLGAAAVMLWRYRLPFMVMPVAVTIWYMSMDVANALMQNHGLDWQFSRDVSLVFGLGTCAMAMWVDVRTRMSRNPESRQDFAFWLYLFGAIMFWGGLSLRNSDSELAKLLYALLNVGLILGGAIINRRVFTVLGALGVAGYLGYLSYRVFANSILFPFALTLLGLGVIWLGVLWQRHEAAIQARLDRFTPAAWWQSR